MAKSWASGFWAFLLVVVVVLVIILVDGSLADPGLPGSPASSSTAAKHSTRNSPSHTSTSSPTWHHDHGKAPNSAESSESGYGSRSPASSHGHPWESHVGPSVRLKVPPMRQGWLGARPRPRPPAPARPKAPCNCNCYGQPGQPLCAMDALSRVRDTFLNRCHVECINCTMNKRYRVVANMACEHLT